jgi:hypothetical protein
MSVLQDVPVATLQHALAVLADEGLIVVRQGRTAVVAGDTVPDRRSPRTARGRDHDCKRAGCQPHMCKPMTAKTIRNIHSILSGAFTTTRRWEWIAWNPAESAKPPAVTRRPVAATAPEDVAKVIAEGRRAHPVLALYLWLVAIMMRGSRAADISGPAGLDNHRTPVMASHRPGGEPGHVLIDTQMGDHNDNRHRSARAPRVPLCGG